MKCEYPKGCEQEATRFFAGSLYSDWDSSFQEALCKQHASAMLAFWSEDYSVKIVEISRDEWESLATVHGVHEG